MQRRYEFVIFDGDVRVVERQQHEFAETSQARGRAGKLAKQHGGRVDLAFVREGEAWEDRYITTAAPCEFNKSGFRFERLN